MFRTPLSDEQQHRLTDRRGVRAACRTTVLVVGIGCLAVGPALAQSGGSGSAFCGTALADTIRNVFSLIQFGGPLIGGTIALGAIVATPITRRADFKRELKEMRNQAIIWGVIVAPLATVLLSFLLANVVAGGSSCTF